MRLLNNFRKELMQICCSTRPLVLHRFVPITCLLFLFLLFLTACNDSVRDRVEKVGGVTAQEIIENPGEFANKTVTVSGHVEKIHTSRAFNMDSGLNFGELLVLGSKPFPNNPDANNRAYAVNDVATVIGTVRIFVIADIKREIGWGLTPEIEAEFDAKPVLIAQTAQFRSDTKNDSPAFEPELAPKPESAPKPEPTSHVNINQPKTDNKITDVGTLASMSDADKLSLADKQAQFSDVHVKRVVGPHTFTLASGEGGDELYVILNEASTQGVGTQGKIDVGDKLNVSGRFEQLEADQINDIANRRFRSLTEQERMFLQNTEIFLRADKVDVLE